MTIPNFSNDPYVKLAEAYARFAHSYRPGPTEHNECGLFDRDLQYLLSMATEAALAPFAQEFSIQRKAFSLSSMPASIRPSSSKSDPGF